MNGETRRNCILKKLFHTTQPISASKIAKEMGVSRQIIVGDIALLRAQGHEINATPLGYIMYDDTERFVAKVVVNHTYNQTDTELKGLIEMGIYVLDISIEHPVYGDITKQLNLRSEHDVQQFVKEITQGDALLLSSLTQGIHIHTLSCENKQHYLDALDYLRNHQLLVENL